MIAKPSGLRAGLCPKCGSKDVRAQRRSFWSKKFIAAGAWDMARVRDFACVDCGYLESYVEPKDLAAIAKNWAPLAKADLD